RREQVEEVRWAGRPDQPMELGDDGQRLGPRRSFEAWTETVRGTSAPWSDADLRIASRLGLALREFHQRGGGQAEARELRGRREQVEEVRWAGRPDQPMELGDDGQRLGPRRSFEAWTETVRGTSAPWSDADLRIASRLGLALREFHQRGGGQAEARELRGRR